MRGPAPETRRWQRPDGFSTIRAMQYDFETVHERRGTDSSKWARFPPDVIPMPVADMDFLSPEPVRRALHERVDQGFYGYGRTSEEFHGVFTSRLKRRYGWDVPTDALVPLPGVISGFNMGLRAVTGKGVSSWTSRSDALRMWLSIGWRALMKSGESVVIQLPSYGPILTSPYHHGLARHEAFLVHGQSGRYEIDWQSFESAFDKTTRVFLLCNPHNPVGRVFSPEELRRMAETCLAHDVWIISDEIHSDLVLDGNVHTPIASLSPEIAKRTITLMSPSKTFNLAGLKASVAIITNPKLRTRFEAAKGGLVGAVNVLGYTAMTAAYRDCDDWLHELTEYLTANRDFLTTFVHERMPQIALYPAEATYLAWLDCNALKLPKNDPFTWFLEYARVGLGDGSNFGTPGEGYVRLNFGCPRSTLEEGLERMARALASR